MKRKILAVNDCSSNTEHFKFELPTICPNDNIRKALNILKNFSFDKNQSSYCALHGHSWSRPLLLPLSHVLIFSLSHCSKQIVILDVSQRFQPTSTLEPLHLPFSIPGIDSLFQCHPLNNTISAYSVIKISQNFHYPLCVLAVLFSTIWYIL